MSYGGLGPTGRFAMQITGGDDEALQGNRTGREQRNAGGSGTLDRFGIDAAEHAQSAISPPKDAAVEALQADMC